MPEKYIPDEHIHDAHRQRMRQKFKEHGSDVFDTYELLEMLLYNSIPLSDTNPVAKRLLRACQSLDGIFSATKDELMNVEGVGPKTAELLSTVAKLPDVIACDPIVKRTMFSDYELTARFFVDKLKDENEYSVLFLLLDNDMIPITLQKLYANDFGSAAVGVNKFTAAALNANASVAIIAHNHPFGPSFPGEGDITANSLVEKALLDIGVVLAEHYIVCGERYVGLVHRKFDCLRGTNELEDFVKGREQVGVKIEKERALWKDGELTFFHPSEMTVSHAAMILRPVAADRADSYARSLLSLYGNFCRILSVEYSRVAGVTDERTAHYIKLIARVTSRRETEKMIFGHMYTAREIIAYLKSLFLGESCEKIYVMSVSEDRRILGCEAVSSGTVNSAGVTPRAVLAAAVKNRAKSVILAHNHPSGRAEASVEDRELTIALSRILEMSSIRLRVHYVVAGNNCEPVLENMNF